MDPRAVTGSLRRYVLFQIPGAALLASALWFGVSQTWLSPMLAVLLWALWVVKDALLFPVLRHAYTPDHDDPGAALRGQTGVARDSLTGEAPEGWVKLGPELWRAVLDRGSAPVAAGEAVRVCDVRGLCLVVTKHCLGGSGGKNSDDSPSTEMIHG